jgi:RNA polymerase sigma-70 factor (ECF subfamily)
MEDNQADRAVLRQALAGDEDALRGLVARLTPIVQARVARCLMRSGQPRLRQELEDLAQDVFRVLFEGDGKVLLSWDPGRGLSLDNFVGLVAQRHALSALRSGKRVPWREDPTLTEDLDGPSGGPGPEQIVVSQDGLERLLDRLRERLSPLGWLLFDLLYLQELSVEEISATTGHSPDAIYAWRTRLRRLARTLVEELRSETAAPQRTPFRKQR